MLFLLKRNSAKLNRCFKQIKILAVFSFRKLTVLTIICSYFKIHFKSENGNVLELHSALFLVEEITQTILKLAWRASQHIIQVNYLQCYKHIRITTQ